LFFRAAIYALTVLVYSIFLMKSLVKAAANGKTKVKWWIDPFTMPSENRTL
jgi:hypothetical protein